MTRKLWTCLAILTVTLSIMAAILTAVRGDVSANCCPDYPDMGCPPRCQTASYSSLE